MVSAHLKAAAHWLAGFHGVCGIDGTAPSGPSHGDFWARNLLLGPSCSDSGNFDVAVVDWESFRPSGPAFYDLFHFPVTYVENYPWHQYRRLPLPEAFRLGFLEGNPVSRALRRYFCMYCSRVGMDAEPLDSLLRAYLKARMGEPGTRQGNPWSECLELLEAHPSAVLSCDP